MLGKIGLTFCLKLKNKQEVTKRESKYSDFRGQESGRVLMLNKLIYYAKPYTMRIIALIITGFLVSMFTALEPATLGLLTDALFSRTNGIALSSYLSKTKKSAATNVALISRGKSPGAVSKNSLQTSFESTGAKIIRIEMRDEFARVFYKLPRQVGPDVVLKSVGRDLAAAGHLVEVAPVLESEVRKRNVLLPQVPTVYIIPFLLVFFQLFRGVFTYFQNYMASSIGQKVVMRLRNEVFEHLQNLSFGFYEQKRTGQLMSKVLNDVGMVQSLFSNTLADLIVKPITVVVFIGIALFLNWKLTLLFVLIMPLIALLVSKVARMMRRIGHDIQQNAADMTAILQETLAAIRVVKSFAMEDYEIGRFRSQTRRNYSISMKGVRLQGMLNPLVELMALMGLGVFVWYGGSAVYRMEMSPSALLTFVFIIGYVSNPIKDLSRLSNQIQHGLAAAENVFKLLDEQSDVLERENPVRLPELRGAIDFENVSFCYKEGEPVLKAINLRIQPGEVIALVGPSGAGKTTLVNLVPRFYDPTGGAISVDGINLREVELKTYRLQMGIVPQETVLFTGTIQENIAYGRIDASSAEIEAAAKAANAHNFISELPDGYRTLVGERGVTLSGGQRQRVAIARAILRDPKILILDEATSALDTASEGLVQEALYRLMKNRTTFVIAHRLSTVRNADRILVLQEGRIVESGTHEELLRLGGLYQSLYQKQFSGSQE
jgi:subfamily B ATP-binding cassette protein MsbA